MTTPSIPSLPHTLAKDTTGGELVVLAVHPDGPEHGLSLRAVDKIAGGPVSGTTVSPVDPADLIRELSRFVPIPAEARKVLTGVIHADTDFSGSVSSAEQTAVLALEHLAAAGLLVGPGEPAASEGEPVGMVDTVGRTWGRDLVNGTPGLCFRHPDVDEAYPLEELRARYGPLAALYARPPVTAEPAETRMDIRSRVLGYLRNEIAEEEVIAAIEEHGLTVTAEPATAPRVDMYEPGSVVYLDGEVWVPGKDYDEKQAENERLRAALEAAEGVLRAKDTVLIRDAEMRTADRKSDEAAARLDVAEQQHVEAYDAWDAARAAVGAEIEEARDE